MFVDVVCVIDLQTQYLLVIKKDVNNLLALVAQLGNIITLLKERLLAIETGTTGLVPQWGIYTQQCRNNFMTNYTNPLSDKPSVQFDALESDFVTMTNDLTSIHNALAGILQNLIAIGLTSGGSPSIAMCK